MEKSERNEKTEDGRRFPIGLPNLSPAKAGLERVGSTAKALGANTIAQNVVRGFFTTKLEQLRPDQMRTLLEDGVFIADLVDEDEPPEPVRTPIGLISNFMSKEEMIRAMDSLVTPQLVAEMLKETAPDVHRQIVEHPGGGKRWFWSQTKALKRKLRRMLARY